MRIFWLNTESAETPMTLVYSNDPPTRQLLFPPEIIKKIIDYLPRSSLPSVSHVSQMWYITAMPILYKHVYIRTLPHWMLLVKTLSNNNFQFGSHITSLVLKPSPKLISAQLTSYLNQTVVTNNDQLQPSTRGYVRLERVNYDLTGLEGIDTPMPEEDEQHKVHENYIEMDDTEKEYEWLTLVTTEQMVSVVSQCPGLEYLSISGCENLQDDVLIQLTNTKKKYLNEAKPFKGIWISLLRDLTPNGIESLMRFEKENFGTSSLCHLDLGYNMKMTQQSLEKVISYWGSTLTHLRLDTIYEVSNQVVMTIATQCNKLRLLHMSRCWNVTNASMRYLSNCKQLRYISLAFLNQVNEEGIRNLIHLLPELQWLNITGCGINPLFKPLVLKTFEDYRRQHHLKPIYMQDGNVNLI